jgi:hypothetical protein
MLWRHHREIYSMTSANIQYTVKKLEYGISMVIYSAVMDVIQKSGKIMMLRWAPPSGLVFMRKYKAQTVHNSV